MAQLQMVIKFKLIGIALLGCAILFAGEIVRSDEPADNAPGSSQEGDQKPAQDKGDEKPMLPAATSSPLAIDGAAELLGRLKPEKLAVLADMIEQDWRDRPEWAEMALAVMRGQAMQPGAGWWRATEKKYGWTWLKRKFDKNSNNTIEKDEFPDDSQHALFLRRLDRDLDGKITTADFDVSIFQGASPAAARARLAEFLFFEFDTDTNGQVTNDELAAFFRRTDRETSSFLTAEDIMEALGGSETEQKPGDSQGPSNSDLLTMFFTKQLGWFEEGPKLGDIAPDFTLTTFDQKSEISLSKLRDKKPVVIIFGSFT